MQILFYVLIPLIFFSCCDIFAVSRHTDYFRTPYPSPLTNIFLLPVVNEDLWGSDPPALRDPELRTIEQLLKDPDERFGSFGQRRKLGPKFISIYPGFTAQLVTLDIGNSFGSGRMTHTNLDLQASFDLKLPDLQITKTWGFSFLLKNNFYNLDKQVVREIGAFSENSGDSSGSSRQASSIVDFGTRVKGRYSYALPLIYYGEEGVDRFRVGIGFGPSEATIEGEIAFTTGSNPFLFAGGLISRDQYLRNLGYFAIMNGTQPGLDPLRTYFLLNLGEDNNLQYYGAYLLSKGQLLNPFTNITTTLQYFLLKEQTNFSDFEILTLLSLGNGSVSTRVRSSGTWVLFWEIPFGDVNIRLSGAGPVFKANNYDFKFEILDIAVYLPIDF